MQATPSWKSPGGWLAAIILVVGVVFLMQQFAFGKQLLSGQLPSITTS